MSDSKKKVYSKSGCRECKRRKIKCDETKPECVQCSRLGKVCDYPKMGEKVLRVSKKYLIDNPEYNQKPPEKRPKKEFILVGDRSSSILNSKLPENGTEPRPVSLGHPVSGPLSKPSSLGSSAGILSSSASSASTSSHLHPQKSHPSFVAPVKANRSLIPQEYQPQNLQPPSNQYASSYLLHSPVNSGPQRLPQQYAPNPAHPVPSHPPYPYPYQAPHGLPHQPYIQLPMQMQYPPSGYPNQNPSPSSEQAPPIPAPSSMYPHSLPSLNPYNSMLPNKLPGSNPHVTAQSPPGTSPDGQISTRNTSPMSKVSNSPNPAANTSNHNGNHSNHNGLGGTPLSGMPISNNEIQPGTAANSDELIKNDILFEDFFNRDDLNLLAGDLNNLVGTMMFESNFERKPENELASLDTSSNKNLISPPSIPSIRSIDSGINVKSNKDRNISFDYIKLKTTQEKYYLEQFYNEFARIILPFNPYDESCGGYFNPSRDVIMKSASKEPFLLAAILAQGAKIAFNKNNLPQDEEFYCNYLSKCLKLLGPALSGNNDKKKRKNLASNIESVLLTVLVLTSANASNIKQDWRPHLRGAKDLLLKYALHSNNLRESKTLIYCKLWFISFELLAGLSSQKGGTLQADSDIDSLMQLDETYEVEALKEVGVITDKGFNYMFGFYQGLLPAIKDLIKFLNKIRESGADSTDPFECIRLLSEYNECRKVVFVSKKLYLSPDDFPNSIIPEGLWLDMQTDNKTIINWLDISQQSYCLAGIVTLLTKGFGLSHKNPKVQKVTDELINLMEILNDIPNLKFTGSSPLMIQWPMLVGGLNCTTEAQKLIVQQFFRISGSGSASFSIQIIDKVWERRKNISGDEYDSVSDVDIDLVTY